jgi:hypothetical protein
MVMVTALAVVLGGAGVAHADPLPPSEALSANVQSFTNNALPVSPFLTTMAANGWAGARGDAFWYRVEPTAASVTDPNKWAPFDALKAKYDAGGVRWQPILETSPGWARNTTGGNVFALPTADHFADFARFAAEFAARYGPGGPMAGALPVTDIEIYNEENAPGAGAYTADPATFGKLYEAARNAITAVAPRVRVIVGAVLYDSITSDGTPTDAQYISGILSQVSAADGIGLHPYAPTTIGVMANIRRMVTGIPARLAGLPVYVNEIGYPAALDGATPSVHAAQGPTTDVARAATTTLETDALLASDCGVRNIAYFDLVNQEVNRADTDYLSSETWKGLERRSDAALTITGQAYRDAGARWRGSPVYGTLHICGAEPATPTIPLPLQLTVDHPSARCLRPTVSYLGFPLEEATVVVRKNGAGSGSSVLTDANGHLSTDFCVDDPTTYTVQAEVSYQPIGLPRFALSVAYSCRTNTTAACTVIAGSGPPPRPGLPPATGTTGTGTTTTTTPTTTTTSGSSLSTAGACLLKSFTVTGSRKLATVLRKGLKLRAQGCRPTAAAADTRTRRLSISATVARSKARSLHLTKHTPKRPFRIASATRKVTGTRELSSITVTIKFTSKVRKALRHAKRVGVTLTIAVTEGTTQRTITRTVALKR